MRSLFLATVVLLGVAGVGDAQIADGERIVEIWTCTLNDGYSMDDIENISERWGALVRSSGAPDVQSYRLTHLVGTMRGHEPAEDVTSSFLFVDSFPDVRSWVAAKRAEDTSAGQALIAEFTQANTCSANALYRSRQSN